MCPSLTNGGWNNILLIELPQEMIVEKSYLFQASRRGEILVWGGSWIDVEKITFLNTWTEDDNLGVLHGRFLK